MSDLLEAAAVTRTFQGRLVLGPLDFTLQTGERLALLGPNGAGKSTLLRCIAGTLSPTSGAISVCGQKAGSRAARLRIGASFAQERSFYLRLTGAENLKTFAQLRQPGWRARRDVDELISELGLEEVAARRVDRCSTGMVQQLSIARALLASPSLLLLDEPTKSLDNPALERFWSAIARRTAGLIIATHRHEDIEHCEHQLRLGPG